jgi:hypothetical protein
MAPTKENLKALLKNMGQNPDAVEGLWAGMIAAPPKTQTERAMAEAKDPYKGALEQATIAEKGSITEKNRAAADPFGLNSGGGRGAFGPGETPIAQSTTELPPGAPLPIGGGSGAQQPTLIKSGQGEKGDAYLSTLPPQTAQAVKAVGDYDMDPSSLLSRGSLQARAQFLSLVKEYNPDFDVKEFKQRNTVIQEFSKGPTARTVRSFNVLVDHLDVLKEASEALKNPETAPRSLNALKNAFEKEMGYPAPNTFDGVKTIVGDELSKAIIGGAGALGDREAVAATISKASSPKQLADIIDKYQKLAAGQLGGLHKQYEGSGRKDFETRFLNPRTREVFQQKANIPQHPSSLSDDELKKKLGL